MRKMKQISYIKPRIEARKRVAAYARVSMDSERLLNSFSQQVSYYSTLIQNNPDWEYAGVYADEAISGTNIARRKDFQRLIDDCDAGKIDIILVKSVSRFARNTVDLLNTVRHLKELNIEVRFEEQHINSLSEDGELMLTLLASFAQAESQSISENSKWAIQKGFEQGRPNTHNRVLGYEWVNDQLVVVPEEADIIRKIFQDFLDGKSRKKCSKELTEQGFTTINGKPILACSISFILRNPTYTGNMILQKTYVEDPFSKKKQRNKGELPQYYVQDNHEAIIDQGTFDKVQEILRENQRKKLFPYNRTGEQYPFTLKVECGKCGRKYKRQLWRNGKKERPTWVCSRKDGQELEDCDSQNIMEKKLMEVTAEVLGLAEFDEGVFAAQIEKIVVDGRNTLIYHFWNGKTVSQHWEKDGIKSCYQDADYRKRNEEHLIRVRANRKNLGPLSGQVICECCGRNFHKETRTIAGQRTALWQCCSKGDCDNGFILNERLEKILADVLETPVFDGEKYRDEIDHVGISGVGALTIYKKDGQTLHRIFEPIPQEVRQRPFKQRNRKKKGESNDGSDS